MAALSLLSSLLLSFLSLASLSLPSAVAQNPSFVPAISWTAALPNILPRRTYPACAYNIHASRSNPPAMFVLGGELNYTNQVLENDVWYSTDGFYADSHQIQPTALLNVPGANFTHRRAGSAVYLNNGNLVWFGGKTDDPNAANSGQLNSVYYSTDQAFTWSQATASASWSARSDIAACVPPYTNTIWQTGGQTPSGGVVNDVWVSTDGIGAVWTPASGTVPYAPFQSGACAFFYDAVPSNASATRTQATLFLLNDLGQFYLTPDLGQTWTQGQGVWTVTGGSRNFMNLLIDRDNVLYVFSGQNYVDANVYWSNDYGTTWYTLAATNGLSLPNNVAFSYATTSCAAFRLWQNEVTGVLYKSIAIYGGSVWLSDNSIVEAVHGVMTATVSFGAAVPTVTWKTAAPAITPRRTYPACTWNIHASLNSPPLMFMLGGELNYTNQVLENDLWYSTDGFFSDSHQIQPTSLLNMPGTNFTHRRAGSAVYLNNGNLVWFGGKTDDPANANSGQLNSVYYSTDNGFTWSQVTATIPWTPRSDMSACAAPFTNTIYFAGGQLPSGAVTNEAWLSQDGIGAVWTQPTTTPVLAAFQSGACAYFYDSAALNATSSQAVSTLLLLDNTGRYTLSRNNGATYSAPAYGPWLVAGQSRNFMNLLIDRSNYVYAFSGQNYLDPSIYYSMDYGTSWYTLAEVNGLALSDSAYFSYATTSCAALRPYQQGGVFYKTISIYGGSVWLSDGSIVESIHGVTSAAITLPSSAPTLSWTSPVAAIMPRRTYCSCAYNVHAPATALPLMLMLGGEVNYTNQILTNDIWYSTDGFYADSHQIQPTALLNAPGTAFAHRRAGAAAFLANGNVLWWGGKNDDPANAGGGQMNSVYYSTDSAQTWSQVTATIPWTPRSDMAACAAPGTNVVFFAGGQLPTGGATSEAWLSQDGVGAVWAQTTTNPPWKAFQSGTCAFFYDAAVNNASSTSTTATLLLLDNDGQLYLSTSYGQSWTGGAYGPWLVAGQSRNYMNLLVDRDNLVFAFAGQNYVDSNVYYSADKGQTWLVLPATSQLALSDAASFSYATTSCAAPLLWQSAVNGGYYKALTIYGGSIWLTDNSIVEAIHGLTTLRSSVTSYGYVAYGGGSGTGSTNGGGGGGSSGLSGGAIAGIVIGSVVGAAALLAVFVCCCVTVGRREGKKATPTRLEESQTGTVDEEAPQVSQVEIQ